MDLTDPDLMAQMVATQETYEFRLAIIKGFFYGSAILLLVVLLLLLWEDFFPDR